MLETQWRKEACCTVTKNVNEYSHYGEQYGVSLKNKEFPYDPAIPLLGIYQKKKSKIYIHPILIAALFKIARTWKQAKCP